MSVFFFYLLLFTAQHTVLQFSFDVMPDFFFIPSFFFLFVSCTSRGVVATFREIPNSRSISEQIKQPPPPLSPPLSITFRHVTAAFHPTPILAHHYVVPSSLQTETPWSDKTMPCIEQNDQLALRKLRFNGVYS